MNISDMKEILDIAHKSRNSVHMIGKHGIGKTEIVKQFAKEAGYHVEVLQLTVMDTGDLMGMPTIEDTKQGKVTTWAKPIWLQRVHQANSEGKHTVIFMDELGRASIDIRQASLQMVLEGKIQEHSLGFFGGLPSLIVVADNPADMYDTEEFDAALEDRFITLNVETSINTFLEYARKVNIVPVIRDFLAEFPERLIYTPETDNEKGSTPRAWEALSRILTAAPKDSGLLYTLIASKVGKTVGSSFFHYFNNYINVISVEDVMKNIGGVKINTEAEQRAAGLKMKELTSKIEVISATELAEKLLTAHIETPEKVSAKDIVIFIISLQIEVAMGILKNWKGSKDAKVSSFYLEGFKAATPNFWFYKELFSKANIK